MFEVRASSRALSGSQRHRRHWCRPRLAVVAPLVCSILELYRGSKADACTEEPLGQTFTVQHFASFGLQRSEGLPMDTEIVGPPHLGRQLFLGSRKGASETTTFPGPTSMRQGLLSSEGAQRALTKVRADVHYISLVGIATFPVYCLQTLPFFPSPCETS